MMDVERIDGYDDPRFPQEVLNQHGAFLVDGVPWAFRIISGEGAAVDGFLRTAADLVIPVTELADGTLCSMDGHTRLYAAWQKGLRRAMAFRCADGETAAGIVPFAEEARKRGIFHIRDMALYSHQEQEEKWIGWCRAYFAGRAET